MALIEVVGTIKLEPSVIKQELNAVEIYPDDIFHSSDEDEDTVEKADVRKSDIANNNCANVEQSAIEDRGGDGNTEDFRATQNLTIDERLVINFDKRIVNDEYSEENSKNTEKSGSSDKVDWANAYKTNETTSCQDDLKKVKKIKTSLWNEPIAPDEFTYRSNTSIFCNYCQREFRMTSRLTQHIKLYHRESSRIFQCPYCPTQSKWDLRYHILAQHKDKSEVNWFQCYLCDKKFLLKSRLARHIKIHSGEERSPCKCPICGRRFGRTDYMKKHLKEFHGNETDWYKCEKCSYTFKNLYSWKKHIEVYHTDPNELPVYKCSKCDFKTRYKNKFSLHCKKHEKTYFCEKCAFTSHNYNALKLHMNLHKKKIDAESLKYHCKKCDYKTYRHYSLKVHELNHLKPEEIEYFYCYHCDFKAKRKDNLKTHVIRHFKKEEVTLQCFMCDFETKTRSTLVSHLIRHEKRLK